MTKEACARCGAERHRGRCKARIAEAITADEVAEAESLVAIEPSYGARLKISGALLEIEQDRTGEDGETYTHTVTLYPHEARQVIDAISTFVQKAA